MTFIVYKDDKVLDIYPGCWATDEHAYAEPHLWDFWESYLHNYGVVAYCIDADITHVCNDNIDFKPSWYDQIKGKVV